MRFLIVGATPLGAYLSAYSRFLAQPGWSGLWLTNRLSIDAIKNNGGLGVFWTGGRRFASDLNMTASLDEAFADITRFDAVLFAMPGYDGARLLFEMRQRVPNPPPIVVLQAGIGNAERVESVYGKGSVLRGALTVTIANPMLNNGQPARETVVLHPSGGIALTEDHPLSHDLAAFLSAAGLPVVIGPGRDVQWSALFWQLYANAIPALVDLSFTDILNSRALFTLEYRQLLEALGVIQALGVRLIDLPGAPVTRLATQLQTLPLDILATRIAYNPTPPIFRAELERGVGGSEAAYLNGAIAVHAQDLKLRTPVNHALALTLQDIAERRALWSQFRGQPAMLESIVSVASGR
jgi:ketopantoate reductase